MNDDKLLIAFSRLSDYQYPSNDKNLKAFAQRLGFHGSVYHVHQCHGTTIVTPDSLSSATHADGLITNKKHTMLAVKTADCVPVLMYDSMNKVIAAIHSGWRGTRDKIVTHAINRLKEDFGSLTSDIHVYLGPAIGPCCYEIKEDLKSFFNKDKGALLVRDSKLFLDLKHVIISDLKVSGIKTIENNPICTFCSKDHYSYRRDKTSQRNYSVIALL